MCMYVALNRAGRETEALHLLEQLAENAINETRYSICIVSQASRIFPRVPMRAAGLRAGSHGSRDYDNNDNDDDVCVCVLCVCVCVCVCDGIIS